MKFQEAFDKVAENYDKIKSQNPGFDGQITVEGIMLELQISLTEQVN